MDRNSTIKLDSALRDWVEENFPETTPAALARTLLELFAVDLGSPVPARYGIGTAEFLRCGKIAFEDGAPVERVIAMRKARIERAVERAFRERAE